jgi:RNA polymerase sigma-70 factor, ECF subfamily
MLERAKTGQKKLKESARGVPISGGCAFMLGMNRWSRQGDDPGSRAHETRTGSAPVPSEVSISFEDFYEVEHSGLFGALLLVTGSRHEAEELSQEAFLKVWERWHLVQSMANPTGYLYRTALNQSRGRLRRARVAARRMINPVHDKDAFESAEVRRDLAAALGALSRRRRAAVVLTELLQFSPAEAGEVLGIDAASVRRSVSRAKQSLRSSMRFHDE